MKACIIIIFLLCSRACAFGDYELDITIYNNSDYTLLTDGKYEYPDTTLNEKMYFEMTLPHSKGRATYSTRRWDRVIVNGKMSIFILDKNIVDNMSWKKIQDDYMILQRYDVSIDELEDLNWTIYYPPTQAMENIYMFPPYEESLKE